MGVFRKVSALYEQAAPLRRKFGTIRGLRLAVQLRSDYKLVPGAQYRVDVPGYEHPIFLRAGTSDYLVFHQIIVEEELAFISSLRPRTVIDAGANIGLSAVYCASRLPDTRILCLEIDADNFKLLRINTLHYPGCIPMLKGLWGRATHLRVANPEDAAYAYAAAEAAAGEGSVQSITVADAILELGHDPVDLLKIDIEGGEVDVFTGPDISWLDRVGTIAVELHDRFRDGCTAAFESLVARGPFEISSTREYTIARRISHPIAEALPLTTADGGP
jgi:FkbM family methyltransferase